MTGYSASLEGFFENRISTIHTCLPARIRSYDAEQQSIEAQPLVKKLYRDGEVFSLPPIVNVPICIPYGQNGGLNFVPSENDSVILVFSERGIHNWKEAAREIEPKDIRKFDLSDAMAIPGLFPQNSSALNEDNTKIWYNNAQIKIDPNGDITLDNGAGTITIESSGAISATNGDGTVSISSGGSITIENDAGNLTELIKQGFELTASQFSDPTKSDLEAIAASIGDIGS